jgi:site-specific DNA recombinase
MRAVLYCRVSSLEQTKNLSLPTQEKACREYCARNGYDVDHVFVDAGESAKSTDRPEFLRLLSYCREQQGSVHAVVVYSLTRFSRQQADHHAITTLLRGLGITLRSVTEPIDESPSGKLMEGILAAMAQFDNDVKSERVTAGMQAALERGRWVNRPPLGYVSGGRGAPSLVPDPDRAAGVREAFSLCASGVTGRPLIKRLTAMGVRTRHGGSLTSATLYAMLKNRVYLGVVRGAKATGEIRGDFEPLVDVETFGRVQSQLLAAPTATRAIARHRNHPLYPLRRFARCGVCSRPLTGSTSKGRTKRYAFYHCPAGCVRFGTEALEAAFLQHLDHLRPVPSRWERFRAAVVDLWETHARDSAGAVEAIGRRIATLQGRGRRLDEAFLYEQAIDRATYAQQRDRLREELALAQIELSSLTDRGGSLEDALDYARDVFVHARLFWLEASSLEKRQLVQWTVFPAGITVMRGSTAHASGRQFEPVIQAVSCWKFFELPELSGDQEKNGAPNQPNFERVADWLTHIRALRLAA